MKYKKSYKIVGKIIKKLELINLVECILDNYKNEKNISMIIEATFNDGTIISDSNISIFENIYFEKIELSEISIHVRVDYANEVDIYIYRNNEYSRATIESDNSVIYNSMCNCVKENIDMMSKQKKIYLLSVNFWAYLGLVFFVIVTQLLLLMTLQYIFKINVPSIFVYIIIALSTPICIYITKYIEKQFPLNQFDFGETSINRYKKEISLIWKIFVYIMLNIIIPLLATYLTK